MDAPRAETARTARRDGQSQSDGGLGGRRRRQAFTAIIKQGRATASPELGYSIHADVTDSNLTAGTSTAFTPGKRRVPSDACARRPPLKHASRSTSRSRPASTTSKDSIRRTNTWRARKSTSSRISATTSTSTGPIPRPSAPHSSAEVMTLDGYRVRYAQYKSDPALQAAHARCPWLMIDGRSRGRQQLRRAHQRKRHRVRGADAQRAVRPRIRRGGNISRFAFRARTRGPISRIMRTRRLGRSLARFHLLDGRQYRSDQACGDGTREVPCGDWDRPETHDARRRSGEMAERRPRDVEAALASAGKSGDDRAIRHAPPGRSVTFDMDKWGGYPAARERLLNVGRETRAESHHYNYGRHSLELGERASRRLCA